MTILIRIDNKILRVMDSVVLFFHNQLEIPRNMLLRIFLLISFFTVCLDRAIHHHKIFDIVFLWGILLILFYFEERRDNSRPVDIRNAIILITREHLLSRMIRIFFYISLFSDIMLSLISNFMALNLASVNGLIDFYRGTLISDFFWIMYIVGTDTLYPPNPPKRKHKIKIGKTIFSDVG